MFRKLEVSSKRKITLQLHLQFNMTYIYIYIQNIQNLKNGSISKLQTDQQRQVRNILKY